MQDITEQEKDFVMQKMELYKRPLSAHALALDTLQLGMVKRFEAILSLLHKQGRLYIHDQFAFDGEMTTLYRLDPKPEPEPYVPKAWETERIMPVKMSEDFRREMLQDSGINLLALEDASVARGELASFVLRLTTWGLHDSMRNSAWNISRLLMQLGDMEQELQRSLKRLPRLCSCKLKIATFFFLLDDLC